jgi:hypothetical protein
MAKMVHTAKQTVKAMVDIQSARPCPATLVAVVAGMMVPRSCRTNTVVSTKAGTAHECFDVHQFYWLILCDSFALRMFITWLIEVVSCFDFYQVALRVTYLK